MGKKELNQRSTEISQPDGSKGQRLEQIIRVDDSFLPAPEELQHYKDIDPRIVELLCRMSENEQKNRHDVEIKKLDSIRESDSREYRINIWGMLFAFLALIVMMGVTAWALYLDRPWIATLFGVLSASTIIGLFISPKK